MIENLNTRGGTPPYQPSRRLTSKLLDNLLVPEEGESKWQDWNEQKCKASLQYPSLQLKAHFRLGILNQDQNNLNEALSHF